MQPRGKELQALLNQQQQQRSQKSLEDLQNGQHQQMTAASNFDPMSSHDDFLEQMLSGLQSSWPDLSSSAGDYCDDQSTFLASKLQQHQISTAGNNSQEVAAKMLSIQQQLLLSSRGLTDGLRSLSGDFPLDLANSDSFDQSQNDNIFKSLAGEDNSVQALLNGFSESLTQNNQSQQFQNPPNFGGLGAATTGMNQAPANGSGGAPSQPRQRVRARRGQATDPHSIAERLRRERIAERMKALQELVPNANKTDKASMLDEIIDYVKFLQLQVKVLSMSRLGGAGAIAPLVANTSSEGGGDCAAGIGGGRGAASSSNDNTMTVTENQVVKLMEEDMGSAMQYLQGKGLCLMPISLATAISTSTSGHHPLRNNNHHPLLQSNNAENGGSSSPSRSALSVQSATRTPTNGISENSIKDAPPFPKGELQRD